MNLAAIKKAEIEKELSLLPDHKLDKVRVYIDSILNESHDCAKNNRSLKGIWQDKGFESIADWESGLEEIRKTLGNSILKRSF